MSVTGLTNKVAHSWSARWHSVPYLFCQSEYWSAVAEGSFSDYHSSGEQWYLCSESIRVGSGQFTSFESGQKEEKIKQLNYSEIIYSCYTSYYALLCMKMAVFFNHLDDIRDTVYFIGLELPYTLLTLFRSFRFFLEESPTTNLQELGWIKVSWVGWT